MRFRRFARTFQKGRLADWKRRPDPSFQRPPAELALLVSQPPLVSAAVERDFARPDFPAEALPVAAAAVERASFESHFAQAARALRLKVALYRGLRLEQDPLPLRACSNELSVSNSAEAQSS